MDSAYGNYCDVFCWFFLRRTRQRHKYDDIVEKIEYEVKKSSEKLNKLVEKEDAGTALTKKENSYKKYYSSYLKAYDQISGSIEDFFQEKLVIMFRNTLQ